MRERSTMGTIYICRRLIERFRDKKIDFLMVFFNLEKLCDRIPTVVICPVLEKNMFINGKYAIKDMYDSGN